MIVWLRYTQHIFYLVDTAWKHHKYQCFWILPLEFGSTLNYINMKTVRFYVKTTINLQKKYLGTPDCKYTEKIFVDFIWLDVQAKSPTQIIYIILNEIWLCGSDPNVPFHAANLVANSGKTAYRVGSILWYGTALLLQMKQHTCTYVKCHYNTIHCK